MAITERETKQLEEATASGRPAVLFIHGLWLLPSSWDRWRQLFEEAGYATLTSSWPDDPETVDEARANPQVFANKTVGQSLAEQSAEILSLIDGFLAKAGTDKSKLLAATIWLSDIRTVDEFNKVWDAWAVAGQTPARACIEALLQGPDKKIEIQVTAAR